MEKHKEILHGGNSKSVKMVETLGAKRKERIKASRVNSGEIINGCILTTCVFVGSVVTNSLQPLNCLPGSSIH